MSRCVPQLNVLIRHPWRRTLRIGRDCTILSFTTGSLCSPHLDTQRTKLTSLTKNSQDQVESLFFHLHQQVGHRKARTRHSFPITTIVADFANDLRSDGFSLPPEIWHQITARLLEEGYILPHDYPESFASILRSASQTTISTGRIARGSHEFAPIPGQKTKVTPYDLGLLCRLIRHHLQSDNIHAAWQCWTKLIHGRFIPSDAPGAGILQTRSKPKLQQLADIDLIARLICLMKDTQAYSDRFPERLLASLHRLNARTSVKALFRERAIQLAILNYVAGAPSVHQLAPQSRSALEALYAEAILHLDKADHNLRNAAFCCRIYLDPYGIKPGKTPNRIHYLYGPHAEQYNLELLRIIVQHMEDLRKTAPVIRSVQRTQYLDSGDSQSGDMTEPSPMSRVRVIPSTGIHDYELKPELSADAKADELRSLYHCAVEGKFNSGRIDYDEARRWVSGEVLAQALLQGDKAEIEVALDRFIRVLGPVISTTWTLREFNLYLRGKSAVLGLQMARRLFKEYCPFPSPRVNNAEDLRPSFNPRRPSLSIGPISAEMRTSLPGQDAEFVRRGDPTTSRGATLHRRPAFYSQHREGCFEMNPRTARALVTVYVGAVRNLASQPAAATLKIRTHLRRSIAWVAGMFHNMGFSAQDISTEIGGIYSAEEVEEFISERLRKIRRKADRKPLSHRQDILSVLQRVSGVAATSDARSADLIADMPVSGIDAEEEQLPVGSSAFPGALGNDLWDDLVRKREPGDNGFFRDKYIDDDADADSGSLTTGTETALPDGGMLMGLDEMDANVEGESDPAAVPQLTVGAAHEDWEAQV